ncbi:MAG: indole-3-glycerol phosphate synthase TrpC [Candidatus Alkanophagales archaeon]
MVRGVLESIVEERRSVVERLCERRSLRDSIIKAMEEGRRPIISEVKRRSPSGRIRDIDVVRAARLMEGGGACGISVHTSAAFGGEPDDLLRVKLNVGVPVLMKDFVVSEFQVYEAYVHGADAVLLIARLLSPDELRRLARLVSRLGMEPLVEIDASFADPSKVRAYGILRYELVGVNNRDLTTMRVDLRTFARVTSAVPALRRRTLVAMSGVSTAEDARTLFEQGAKALLIGTSIMRSADIRAKVEEFVRC